MNMSGEYDTEKRNRVRKYGEVFTPQDVVEDMCDMLEGESPDAFEIEKTYLEPACGEGVFVVEILRRKFAKCVKRVDYSAALASVWAMDIQERNVEATIEAVSLLCGQYFRPTAADYETIVNHVILCDSLKVMRMMNELNEREAAFGVEAM